MEAAGDGDNASVASLDDLGSMGSLGSVGSMDDLLPTMSLGSLGALDGDGLDASAMQPPPAPGGAMAMLQGALEPEPAGELTLVPVATGHPVATAVAVAAPEHTDAQRAHLRRGRQIEHRAVLPVFPHRGHEPARGHRGPV